MIFIVGGYAQGKRKFCEAKFPGRDYFVFDHETSGEELLEYEKENPDCIIISTEIGCGVVPVGKEDRERIERVGRMQIKLAERSKEVWRVVCGQGIRIK